VPYVSGFGFGFGIGAVRGKSSYTRMFLQEHIVITEVADDCVMTRKPKKT
jgi:hypothetical protein